jgi:hypothetical protein
VNGVPRATPAAPVLHPANAKGRPEGRPFHCRPRSAAMADKVASVGRTLAESENPGPVRPTRIVTMRHWITSFLLLTTNQSLRQHRFSGKSPIRTAAAGAGAVA